MNLTVKHSLIVFLIISFHTNSQWQVIDDTDSITVTSVHVNGDYLFATLGSSTFNGPVTNAFRRYSLTNPYQMQTISDSLGVPYGPGEVVSLGEYDGGLLALHRNLTTWFNYVMTSTDNGLTWEESYSFSYNSSPVRLLGSGIDLYIGANRSSLHSQDLNQPYDFLYYESFYVNTSMKPLLIHNGDGYFSQAAGLMRNSTVINSLEFRRMAKIGNDFYGFAQFDNFFKSTDSGDTWSLVATHPFNYDNIYELKYFNGSFYACTEEGVFVSVDQGINWVDISYGLPKYNGVTMQVNDIAYYNGNLFAATILGAFVLSESEILSSLGIDQNEISSLPDLVYPNPTDESVFVKGNSFNSLVVSDGTGREIPYRLTQKEEGVEISLIDFQGMCFIRYSNANGMLTTHRVLVR